MIIVMVEIGCACSYLVQVFKIRINPPEYPKISCNQDGTELPKKEVIEHLTLECWIVFFKAFVLISNRLFISIFPLVVKECHFLNYDHCTLIFLQTYVGCHLITVGSGLKTRCPWMECPSKILSCKNPSELFKFASKLRLRGSRCKNPCVSVFKNARRPPRTLQHPSRQDVKLPALLD